MIKKNNFYPLFVYLCLIYSGACHAKASLSNNVIFVTEHLPPFQIAQQGQVSGFATELLKAAVSETDINASYIVYPWSRAYNLAQERPNTCIYSIARTPQREQLFHWVDVLTQTNSHFIGLKSRTDIDIKSVEDAKRYKVAVLKDDVTHQLLLAKGFKEFKNLYVVNNTQSLLKLLVLRTNIDLILADNLTVTYRALYNDIAPSQFAVYLKVNQSPLDFYLACNLETSKETIQAIKSGFAAIRKSGQYQKISHEWKQLVPDGKDIIQ
ncbi:substrate-binding periplasmic protein [Thalassotalea marina]|uniref:Solute-binding protein family 3/N-terminal domain-containing protein n=1 Tax=Thalassotalea marina TaxID=1673741 RepID=A0A919BMV0_9GAMM|nr:transporter substrate-binding domain-containing protein [Thalassotalea marina]GHG02019.1 hypothetical protein GCM10017161_33550 [Thalassotalea marina]